MSDEHKPLKVMTVVGTRPELIRLSQVISELDKTFEHVLVHTGQNFDPELGKVFFEDLQIRTPDFYLDCARGSKGTAETIANIMIGVDALIESEKPDAFLVLGDTNSCLSAISAKKRKVPIFHMEAGNRCFDQRVPEEINRKIVDHISDVNLPYSTIARDYLLAEGLSADFIIKTGSPMAEVINKSMPRVINSTILQKLNLERNGYFVVSAHREENIGPERMFLQLIETLNSLVAEYNIPVIVSTHPKLRQRIEKSSVSLAPSVVLLPPLGYFDYLSLQVHAKAVLSDSGTISEESSIMKFPALNLREAHERPESMEEANVMMVGLNRTHVLNSMRILLNSLDSRDASLETPFDYQANNVSKKIARIIQSYTPYVNRKIWAKSND